MSERPDHATQDPLLRTKLYVPTVPPGFVTRPRLLDTLTAGSERRLLLVCAPAGYGKTTLVAAWFRRLADRRQETDSAARRPHLSWLSLDRHDDDPARFLRYLLAALHPAFPAGQAGAPSAPSLTRREPLGTFLPLLINRLAAQETPVFLVLDDYHVIRNRAIHDGLTLLLEHGPPSLHLLLLTRTDPPLPLARLRAANQMSEIRQHHLRFTTEEAAVLTQQVAGLPLSTADVETLARRTEGWPSGLHLATLALQRRAALAPEETTTVAHFIAAFAGTDRYIMDYLTDEVLQQQPPAVLTFLLRTSILDRLSAPLCAALLTAPNDEQGATGSEAAQAMLQQLENENLFILALDNERRWYRYHRLFADLLRKRLQQREPELGPTLHGRASRWYESAGMIIPAVDHALQANDNARAATLIAVHGEAILMRSQVATLLGWLEALPPDLRHGHASLLALHAGVLLMSGHPLSAVEACLRAAEDAEASPAVAAQLNLYRALLAVYRGELDDGLLLAQQAEVALPPGHPFFQHLLVEVKGFVHTLRGDVAAADAAFADARARGEAAGNMLIAAGARGNQAGLYMTAGDLQRAATAFREALALATDASGQRLPIAGKALFGLAEIHREWNDLETAHRYARESLDLSLGESDASAIVARLTLARIVDNRGDRDRAQQLVDEARRLARQFDVTEIDDLIVDAYQVQLWLAAGDLAAAKRWAAAEAIKPPPGPHLQDVRVLTEARVLLACGQAAQAIAPLATTVQRAEGGGRLGTALKARTLLALAYEDAGDRHHALEALTPALSLGARAGYVRAFLDLGAPMARLLYHVAAHGLFPDYAGALLAAFPAAASAPPAASSPHDASAALVEPLSERELEVLQLLALGLSNREIAERLVISLSTVKGHNSNIYGKLAAANRTEAVSRARALGLLTG